MVEPHVQLEQAWGDFLHIKNVVSCSSGSSALHLALEALDIHLASEVVTADYSMIACPRAIVMAGLVPAFMDCNDDLLMQLDGTQKMERSRTLAAILVVHVYGRRVDMDLVHRIAKKREILVIEDMAELHGVPPHPLTHAACWSFYKNKVVGGEEGGAVSFRDPKHAERARSLRCLGFGYEHDYMHLPRGCNYRMSSAHANLILKSLDQYENNLATRRLMEKWYDSLCPKRWRMPPRQSPWVYDLRIPEMTKSVQAKLVERLNADGIPARHGFKPMTWQTEFKNCRRNDGVMKSWERAHEIIYLPLNPAMGKTEFDREQLAVRAFKIVKGT